MVDALRAVNGAMAESRRSAGIEFENWMADGYNCGMATRTERILTAMVLSLIVVALGLAGLMQWVRHHQRNASAVSASLRVEGPAERPQGGPSLESAPPSHPGALPIPKDQVGSPYMPWPVSFPKLLPGFFMLEDRAPALKLTPRQARQLLPIIEQMGRNWKTVHSVEIRLRRVLSPEQKAWITREKHTVEKSTDISKVMAVAGKLEQGENASVKVALQICTKYMPSPVPTAWKRQAQAERKRELAPHEYEQRPGEEWLTVFDETTALFRIEQEQPQLHLSGQQAVMIHAILQDVVKPLKVVSLNEGKVRQYLTEEQIKYVQTHMSDLYLYRTGQIRTHGGGTLAFPGNAVTKDETYHDPLYYETVRFLKAKVAASYLVPASVKGKP